MLLVLLFLWWVRPIFHGLVMFFYTSPIVWFPPIAILAIGFAARRFRRPKLSKRDLELLAGREGEESSGGARRHLPSAGVGVVTGLAFAAFLLGAAFNHYIAFPFMMVFFASFNTPDLAFMPKLEDVFGLYSKMLLGMGVVFQMPTVVFFLAKMKMVTARFLLKHFKYAFLIIFIAAAVITPTGDMMTQAIFAAPMVGLYMLSIVIAWIVGPKRLRGGDAEVD